MTKKYRAWTWVLGIVSILLNICPLAVYTLDALIHADLVNEKVGLCCTVFIVLILSIIAWINKTTMRSRVWVIMLGLYFCLDSFVVPLIIIACTQILDEWVISPVYKYCKSKYSIHKEIDKRL